MVLKLKNIQIREKRIGTISGYFGPIENIINEYKENKINQRVRTFSQDIPNDIIYALDLINTIKDSAIVIHGPKGCGISQLYFSSLNENGVTWNITNLDEKDSILGSDVKLNKAVKQLYKNSKAKNIFIITTPVVAINNDDVESVVEELKEELGINIFPVYTDGFRSKVGATGYDSAIHSIIKHGLLSGSINEEGKEEYVNLITVSENSKDIDSLTKILNKMGVKVNIGPRYSENILNLKGAKLSISVDHSAGELLGDFLENRYNIRLLKPTIPIGINKSAEWLLEIGKETEKLEEVKNLIEKEKAEFNNQIEGLKFKDTKIFLSVTTKYTFGLVEFLKELGILVVGIKLPYIDKNYANDLENLIENNPEIQVLIGDGNVHEEFNLLNTLRPDIYIGEKSQSVSPANLGIATIDIKDTQILGFTGALNLVKKIKKVLSNKSFIKALSNSQTETYKERFLKRKPNWYIKQEVK